MIEYRIERNADGVPARMWWIPPEARPRCACGSAMKHINFYNQPECEECWKVRTGYYFKGRNAGCQWCAGRGCLACEP